MEINSVSSSLYTVAQTTVRNRQAESIDSTTTQTSFGDTVTISDEAASLALQEAGQSESTNLESGGQSGVAQTASGSATASDDSSIEELEAKISALKSEIAALSAEARIDETAQGELKSKQAELAALESELALAENLG